MMETKDLILRKAEFDDWKAMYRNVWSHPETARYMMWRVTETEEAAQERIRRHCRYGNSKVGIRNACMNWLLQRSSDFCSSFLL